MRKDRRLFPSHSGGVALAVAILGCSPDAPSAPVPRDAVVAPSNIVRRPPNANYIERSRRTLQGQHIAGGVCSVRSVDTLRVGERVLEWVAEYDTVACVITLARGEYVGPPRSHHGSVRVETDTSGLRAAYGGLSYAMRSNSRVRQWLTRGEARGNNATAPCDELYDAIFEAHQYLYVEDPLQVDVTRDNLSYQFWTRPSLNCIQQAVATHYMSWYAPTHWQKYSDGFYHNYISSDRTYADVSVFSAYLNLPFCDPSAFTYSTVNNNQIRVFPDGHATYEATYYWYGDCSWLLHGNREFGSTGG